MTELIVDINAVTRTKTATEIPTPTPTTVFPLATTAVPIDASPIALVFGTASSAPTSAASSSSGSSSRPITSAPTTTGQAVVDNGIIGLLTGVPPTSSAPTGAAVARGANVVPALAALAIVPLALL